MNYFLNLIIIIPSFCFLLLSFYIYREYKNVTFFIVYGLLSLFRVIGLYFTIAFTIADSLTSLIVIILLLAFVISFIDPLKNKKEKSKLCFSLLLPQFCLLYLIYYCSLTGAASFLVFLAFSLIITLAFAEAVIYVRLKNGKYPGGQVRIFIEKAHVLKTVFEVLLIEFSLTVGSLIVPMILSVLIDYQN